MLTLFLKAVLRVGLINRFVAEEELPDIFGASDFCSSIFKGISKRVLATSIHYNLPIIALKLGI